MGHRHGMPSRPRHAMDVHGANAVTRRGDAARDTARRQAEPTTARLSTLVPSNEPLHYSRQSQPAPSTNSSAVTTLDCARSHRVVSSPARRQIPSALRRIESRAWHARSHGVWSLAWSGAGLAAEAPAAGFFSPSDGVLVTASSASTRSRASSKARNARSFRSRSASSSATSVAESSPGPAEDGGPADPGAGWEGGVVGPSVVAGVACLLGAAQPQAPTATNAVAIQVAAARHDRHARADRSTEPTKCIGTAYTGRGPARTPLCIRDGGRLRGWTQRARIHATLCVGLFCVFESAAGRS